MVWLYISMPVFLNGLGQLMLKKGVDTMLYGEIGFPSLEKLIPDILSSPLVLAGLACSGISMLVWLKILSISEVSYAYPITVSLTYALVVAGSGLVLGEDVSMMRMLGIVVIVTGVFIAGMT